MTKIRYTHADRILDTVREFLDTHPDLEGSELRMGRGVLGTSLRRFMTVTIDGEEFTVMVHRKQVAS